MIDAEELEALVDEAVAHFGDSSDVITVELDDGKATMSFRLSDLIEDMLDVMQSDVEADDMMDLSRHLASLARRIRRVVDEREQTRGEP